MVAKKEGDVETFATSDETASIPEIVERLTILGVSDQEARVYVHLCRMGICKASDVATTLRLQRTETYRTLQALVERGFASATLGRPAKYEARQPDRLFGELIREKVAETRSLLQAQSRLVPKLMTLMEGGGDEVSPNAFKVIQGRQEAYRTMDRMIRDATEGLEILTTHPGAISMLDAIGVWDLAIQRAADGVKVRILIGPSPRLADRAAMFRDKANMEVRLLDTEEVMRFVVVDGRELLQFVVSDVSAKLTSDQDVSVWTTAQSFARTQRMLFGFAWDRADKLPG